MVDKKTSGLWTNEELRKALSCDYGDYMTTEEAMARGYVLTRWNKELGIGRGRLARQLRELEEKGGAIKETIRVRNGDKRWTTVAYKVIKST